MDFTRQATLCDPNAYHTKEVTIIGAGGIGAATTLAMAKCGFESIIVYDFDVLDRVNGPNQMLPLSRSDRLKDDLFYGAHKVHALAQLVYDMTLTIIKPETERYVDQSLSEIVISAVDSMDARKLIWESAKKDPAVNLLIDGRMGRESLAIYVVDLLDESTWKAYEESLHTDVEAIQIPCTEKATIFTNLQIASWITKIATAWALKKPYPHLMRINMANYLVVTA
jgi:molybdopterin/thiamine biosynthesis adenylyltransferase